MFEILSQRPLLLLGHARCMEYGRLGKVVLDGEFAGSAIDAGRPVMRFKDVCERHAVCQH